MEYESLGRRLGIGARLARKLLKAHAERSARRQAAHPLSAAAANTGVRAHAVGKGLARGSRGFWSNSIGPFASAGKTLWLEITGLFFGLFALFFAQNVYRLRTNFVRGSEHEHFIIYCVLLVLFGYFSTTSFMSARRASRAGKH